MLKTTLIDKTHASITLRLDGTLSRSWINDLQQLCRDYRANKGQTVVLDLSGVTFIDAAGLKMLAELKKQGIKTVNPSLFVRSMISTMGPDSQKNHDSQDET